VPDHHDLGEPLVLFGQLNPVFGILHIVVENQVGFAFHRSRAFCNAAFVVANRCDVLGSEFMRQFFVAIVGHRRVVAISVRRAGTGNNQDHWPIAEHFRRGQRTKDFSGFGLQCDGRFQKRCILINFYGNLLNRLLVFGQIQRHVLACLAESTRQRVFIQRAHVFHLCNTQFDRQHPVFKRDMTHLDALGSLVRTVHGGTQPCLRFTDVKNHAHGVSLNVERAIPFTGNVLTIS